MDKVVLWQSDMFCKVSCILLTKKTNYVGYQGNSLAKC